MILSSIKNVYWRWRLRNEAMPKSFCPEEYRALHRDVAASGLDPKIHYLRFGRSEGRDPGPNFSASGYRLLHPHEDFPDPLMHYEQSADVNEAPFLPELDGEQSYRNGQPSLVVCGHQAGPELYGAERSLLEVLEAMRALGWNVFVVLPSAQNPDYVARVRALSWRLAVIPYGWWRSGCGPVAQTVNHFVRLLKRVRPDLLYVNTLVLDEPLRAARALAISTAVHVRELPKHDPALCSVLGATPEQIMRRVSEWVDYPLVNSTFTATAIGLSRANVIPNGVKVDAFAKIAFPASRGEPFTVGMISSNIPKKGLYDFVELARCLQAQAPEVRCRLIGPESAYIQQLKRAKGGAQAPGNLDFFGYTETPQQALAQVDVLVNLSHFEESFGRSVLEAMAAGRPVVAYHWGALPELLEEGKSGCLVPLGAVDQVADRVSALYNSAEFAQKIGRVAQKRARTYFDQPATMAALKAFYDAIK